LKEFSLSASKIQQRASGRKQVGEGIIKMSVEINAAQNEKTPYG
jgi:hypothetical protein